MSTPKGTKRAAATKLDPDVLAALEEQRDFLLRSLTDLDREHDAGDLDDHDHAELRDDYTARAAEVIRAIDEQHDAFADAKRPRSLGRTLAWVAGVALFAVVSGVMVASAMGARKAGESASGGITVRQTASQRANQCLPKMQSDPDGVARLPGEGAQGGPRERGGPHVARAGAVARGRERDRPAGPAAAPGPGRGAPGRGGELGPELQLRQGLRAVVAYRNGRYEKAQEYLDDFKARNPSAQAAQIIEQMDLQGKITGWARAGH